MINLNTAASKNSLIMRLAVIPTFAIVTYSLYLKYENSLREPARKGNKNEFREQASKLVMRSVVVTCLVLPFVNAALQVTADLINGRGSNLSKKTIDQLFLDNPKFF